MILLFYFLPILLFVTLYVGSGIYFLFNNVDNAFYQISPVVAIIPALIFGWIQYKGTTKEKMRAFLDGIGHQDIIIMCIVFLLAGAFSSVTKTIGSVDATINVFLSFIPAKFLLLGLFTATAFVSTAIGSAMGCIAALGPIIVGLAQKGAFPIDLGIATLVGGAMFGDNLSFISDTTIAAITSQQANAKEKFKVNATVAIISFIITAIVILSLHYSSITFTHQKYSFMLTVPYLFLITLALFGINVFIVLICSLILAGMIGFFYAPSPYSLITFCKNINQGFTSMYDIMLLSMFVGGLSGLMKKGMNLLAQYFSDISLKKMGTKTAQLLIGGLASLFDILLANNTIAIIFSGKLAKEIAQQYNIPPHYSAAWLDIFSCVFQGIIPYGAQILLASAISGVSPLCIITKVYYCYILFIVAVLHILFKKI
jgi:Na+/H+ antiporter NhaC